MNKRHSISDWIEDRQARGSYSFCRRDAEAAYSGSSIAIQNALRRLKQKGRIASPYRGFYVVVPPEYRSAGCPPASWFIDDLMRHVGRHYYVGLLTAAAQHGAAHQQPMSFQVLVDRVAREMTAGRVRIEAHYSRKTRVMPVMEIQTETGTMTAGTPETTAIDLARFPGAAGGWSHVATVLSELAEGLKADRLLNIAPLVQLPDVQRLGFLLDLIGEPSLADPLAEWLSARRTSVVHLRPDLPAGKDQQDPRWRLIPNEPIEADL